MMSIVAGLDIGSRMTKAVLIDECRRVVGKALARTNPQFEEVSRAVLTSALSQANIRDTDLS
jgi:activator of 2-hydroxyglutaryl-CoA dehydratase